MRRRKRRARSTSKSITNSERRGNEDVVLNVSAAETGAAAVLTISESESECNLSDECVTLWSSASKATAHVA